MASAVQLNATATIINGQGLARNSDLASAVVEFQTLPTTVTVANIFATAANSAAGVDLTQNTNITLVGNFANGAYSLANTSATTSSGTSARVVSGITYNASTGILSLTSPAITTSITTPSATLS